MQLLALGLNHQTAPLALREQVAFVPEEVGQAISRLCERFGEARHGGLSEAAIVSTCNRTELYCAVEEPDVVARQLTNFLAEQKQLDRADVARASYLRPRADAVRLGSIRWCGASRRSWAR